MWKTIRRILTYTKRYTFTLALALFSALVSVSLSLLAPVLIGEGIDCIVGPQNVDFACVAQILMLLAAVIAGSAPVSYTHLNPLGTAVHLLIVLS